MLSQEAAYRAGRELLRYRHHPLRLRRNPLLGHRPAYVADSELPGWLEGELRCVVDRMTARRAQILRRCDLDGEEHRTVMYAMGLSERQFYRERREAIVQFALHFLSVKPEAVVEPAEDRFALQMAAADALERAGRPHDAIAVLHRARDGAAENAAARMEVRLAELYRDAAAFRESAIHADQAQGLCSDADECAADQLQALRATIAWQSGALSPSTDTLENCAGRLHLAGNRATLMPHALADLLQILAEGALECGDWRRGTALFERAHASLERTSAARADVFVRSLIWVATARSWIAGQLPTSIDELLRAYACACRQSLPREAALALGRVCQLLDLGGETQRAMDLATKNLLPAAGDLIGDWRASAHLDIASTCLSAGQFTLAGSQLRDAAEAAPPGSFSEAAVHMHRSEVELATRDFSSAIVSAEAAVSAMERLGRPRHVGVALAVRATAQWQLGRRSEASSGMRSALDMMAGRAHPLRIVAFERQADRMSVGRRSR
jgi:hypothetical protein